MLTLAAARSIVPREDESVRTVDALLSDGLTHSQLRSQLRAHRWQRLGRAVVLHNGPPTRAELERVALITLGPRALLTSFTALQTRGLTGWEREHIHVVVPRGARIARPPGLALHIHYTDSWHRHASPSPITALAHAALLAASGFRKPRPACGLLAAAVQQRLLRPADLVDALGEQPRLRHRRALLLATHYIAQGAQALSEIDFGLLCRRHHLPTPARQVLREMADGRRRYVDAEWRSRSGRRIVAEVDGALHMAARRWWDDQLRQNELVIGGDTLLRFPSVVFRQEQLLVAGQLSRALAL